MTAIKVLGIVGSLSETSLNAALMGAVAELMPANTEFKMASLADIPIFNDALSKSSETPAAVQQLREQIAAADAIVIATPEYNYSIPSLLKAALEWVSRPPSPPFVGKAAAVLGATSSQHGTVRAQTHLRQILVSLNAHAVNAPHVDMAEASRRFTDGRLTDEASRTVIAELLGELCRLASCLQRR